MKAETVTVGVPVRDLDLAIAWYRAAFELGEPDQIPLDGLAEFDLGAFWLQLALAPELAGSRGHLCEHQCSGCFGGASEICGPRSVRYRAAAL